MPEIKSKSKPMSVPVIRLAHADGAQGDNVLKVKRESAKIVDGNFPALLISFVYLPSFLKNQADYYYRDWALDSGAFSAWKSGTVIELSEYIEACLELMQTDKTLTDIFALDVIGDHKASIKNCETMWEFGVPAIPTFHTGEPEGALFYMAKHFPKIAVGGLAGSGLSARTQLSFCCQVFARIWPKRIHGFGVAGKGMAMALPFHSIDATSWEMGPCAFGNWNRFGKMSVRGSSQNLRSEVDHYLGLERLLRARWAKEMTLLERLPKVRN